MTKSKTTAAAPPADTSYTVVARRYRPQQFVELIGQEHVSGALVNALQSGRVAHAYLFTGARGVGKTSAARILAKALNCEKGPTATPCDRCESCQAVMTGDDIDVLEIDGASNNKVDEARDLRQNIGFRPTRGRYKIYIIDEVHMLTTGAFNALLKTLEEPPEHVKFILATTEVQKIPITILSRCQRFDFAHVGPGKIFDQLKRIVEREGHKAEDAALKLIARRAAGSMRDSQSLLDQLLASSSGSLTAAQVNAVLGTAGDDRVIELATAIFANNPKTALDLIAGWVERGLQIGELVDEVVEYWRALMLVKCGGPDISELPASPNQLEAVKKQANTITLDAILAGLEVLTATKTRMRGSSHTQVLLEMAVVRLCHLSELLAVGQLVQSLRQGDAYLTAAPARTAPSNGTEIAKKNGPLTPRPNESAPTNGALSTTPLTDSSLRDVWQRFLQHIDEKSPFLAKQLRLASSCAISGPNSLAIRFSPSYTAAYDACGADSGTRKIQDLLQQITGHPVAVRIEKDTKAAAPVSDMPSGPVAVDRKKSLATLPLFKKAQEALGAQIWHVDDDFNPVMPPRLAPRPETETDTDEV